MRGAKYISKECGAGLTVKEDNMATTITTVVPAYSTKMCLTDCIENMSPIVYFPLDELSGTTAINHGTLGAPANGTYINVPLAQIEAPGGGLAPSFDDALDTGVNIYTTALRDAFDGNEGSLAVWAKWTGTWNNGTSHDVFNIECVSNNNQLSMSKYFNNTFIYYWNPWDGGQGDMEYVQIANFGAGWVSLAMVWSDSGDFFKAYKNGVQQGATQTGLYTWIETIDRVCIGTATPDLFNGWIGNLAHAALWDRILTPDELALIYAIGSM